MLESLKCIRCGKIFEYGEMRWYLYGTSATQFVCSSCLLRKDESD